MSDLVPPGSPSTLLAVIGITGDLSHRYLLPALAEVRNNGHLPADFHLLGLSRRNVGSAEVLTTDELKSSGLADVLDIYQIDLDNADAYNGLAEKVKQYNAEQIIFYFAVPPNAVDGIVNNLGKVGLNSDNVKLLLEKPFGKDLQTAKEIISNIQNFYSEEQVYRIDHYLAKEMSQNVSVFLGGNALFRHSWNKDYIERIEVNVEQDAGIEGRAKFYEQTGALRDIVQSHALQLVALTIAEPCSSVFEFTQLPGRRLQALRSLRLAHNQEGKVAGQRAQYQGYKQEVGNEQSNTETFVRLELYSELEKWQGVPISIVTGKALKERKTEVRVQFRKTEASETNQLVLRIQPNEGIEIDLWVKEPGYERKLKKVSLSFDYDKNFGRIPNAYEQVLVEALRSSKHLFPSSDEVLASWELLQPLQDQWQDSQQPPTIYPQGSDPSQIG